MNVRGCVPQVMALKKLPKQLPPHPWIEAPDTRAVIDALTRDGGQARFVGGCVRDALLGREVQDIDIATPDPPETVMQRLARADIRAIPTGIAHGTVTAVVDARHFEITTLRRDVETDGRHARVAFTDDWREDAARRDFTINAMSLAARSLRRHRRPARRPRALRRRCRGAHPRRRAAAAALLPLPWLVREGRA